MMAETERLALIQDRIRRLSLGKDEEFAGMTEAERAAERQALVREYLRRRAAVKAPDFSGMSEAERAAEAQKQRQKFLEEARKMENGAQEQTDPEVARQMEVAALWNQFRARIIDFDPKQGGVYHNRFYFVEHPTFDLDEESPLGPMRFTGAAYTRKGPYQLCESVNIFSIKIASSDVGFPIHVYGTVVARDNIDNKCIYLFRRNRNDCQLINSEDESLILTGPERGLLLVSDNYVETDLKIKDHRGQDRELNKGIMHIKGIAGRSLAKCEVENKSLATRLSTVDVLYAVVKRAMEATIAVEVERGDFNGKITAHTKSIENRIVLYDSKVAGAVAGDGNTEVQLMRRVVCVYVKDTLVVVVGAGDGASPEVKIEFTPVLNGRDEDVVTIGALKMRVKIAWSIVDE